MICIKVLPDLDTGFVSVTYYCPNEEVGVAKLKNGDKEMVFPAKCGVTLRMNIGDIIPNYKELSLSELDAEFSELINSDMNVQTLIDIDPDGLYKVYERGNKQPFMDTIDICLMVGAMLCVAIKAYFYYIG